MIYKTELAKSLLFRLDPSVTLLDDLGLSTNAEGLLTLIKTESVQVFLEMELLAGG